MNFLVGQYAFGAKPRDEFVKKLIDYINDNINSYIEKGKNNKSLRYVYTTTGPDFVTDMYLDYDNTYKIHILKYDKEQYFGKYAKHNHYGTWK